MFNGTKTNPKSRCVLCPEGAAEARDNAEAEREALFVPRDEGTNRNSFSRHWEHGKLANDSTIRPYSPILAPAAGANCLSERVEHDWSAT